MTRLRSFRNISICGRSVRPAAFSRFKPQGDRVARYFARNCPVRARVVKGGVRLSNRLSNQVMTTVLSQRASTASRIEYVHCTLFLPGTLSVTVMIGRRASVRACTAPLLRWRARESVRGHVVHVTTMSCIKLVPQRQSMMHARVVHASTAASQALDMQRTNHTDIVFIRELWTMDATGLNFAQMYLTKSPPHP